MSLSIDPVKGTINIVLARGFLVTASVETTNTGRGFLSGGSVGGLKYQISPRCGVRCVVILRHCYQWETATPPPFPMRDPLPFLVPSENRSTS